MDGYGITSIFFFYSMQTGELHKISKSPFYPHVYDSVLNIASGSYNHQRHPHRVCQMSWDLRNRMFLLFRWDSNMLKNLSTILPTREKQCIYSTALFSWKFIYLAEFHTRPAVLWELPLSHSPANGRKTSFNQSSKLQPCQAGIPGYDCFLTYHEFWARLLGWQKKVLVLQSNFCLIFLRKVHAQNHVRKMLLRNSCS